MTDQKIGRQITGSFTKRHNLNVAFITDSGTTDIPAADPLGDPFTSEYYNISAGATFFNCPEVVVGEDLQLDFRLSRKSTVSIFYTVKVGLYFLAGAEVYYYVWSNIVLDGTEVEPPVSTFPYTLDAQANTAYYVNELEHGEHNIKLIGHTNDPTMGAFMTYPRLTILSSDLINE